MHAILTRGGVLTAVVASACAKAQQVQDDKAGSGTVPPDSVLQVSKDLCQVVAVN